MSRAARIVLVPGWEALRGHAAQRADRDERAAMGWEDPGCPREPEAPTQGWRDWWLRDQGALT